MHKFFFIIKIYHIIYKMLGDSLHEACEIIWEAVQNYAYSEDYKTELVTALTKMGYTSYQLDRIKNDCVWTEEDYKNEYVLKRWARRNCSDVDD